MPTWFWISVVVILHLDFCLKLDDVLTEKNTAELIKE